MDYCIIKTILDNQTILDYDQKMLYINTSWIMTYENKTFFDYTYHKHPYQTTKYIYIYIVFCCFCWWFFTAWGSHRMKSTMKDTTIKGVNVLINRLLNPGIFKRLELESHGSGWFRWFSDFSLGPVFFFEGVQTWQCKSMVNLRKFPLHTAFV